MQISKNKTKATLITLFLVSVIAFPLIQIPSTNAATARYIDSYMFLSAVPSSVGVGQRLIVCFWLALLPPELPSDLAAGNRAAWNGLTVTVSEPGGMNRTLGTYKSDVVGAQYLTYVPDKVGTYYFQASFAGEWKNVTGSDNYYKPAISPSVKVIVQEEALSAYPETPLPTNYWDRPINNENWKWSSIAGNWYGMSFGFGSGYNAYGRFNPYSNASDTAHIVWTKEIGFGGNVGGEFGDKDYYSGIQYEQRFYPTVALNGYLYFNLPKGTQRNGGGFVCVDMRTGEQLWWVNETLTMGQIYDYDSPNQHGPIPQLWGMDGSTWNVYDPFSGQWLYKFVNASSGTMTFSGDGSILAYLVGGSYPNRWLAMWNSSAAPALLGGTSGTNYWQWRPYGKTIDWRTGIQWNKTFNCEGNPSISKLAGDKFIWRNTYTLPDGNVVVSDSAFDLRAGNEGKLLWGPTNRTSLPSVATGPYGEGVYVSYVKETMQWYGYDANTGSQLWGPTKPYSDPFGMYGSTAEIAYGKIYTMSYGGTVYCWDIKTGDPLWEYYTGDAGFETPYGHYPQWEGMLVADGKVFVTSYEHSPDSPLWRGARMFAIDTETGKLVWNILGWYQGSGGLIADGYMVQHNFGDDRVYCFGKGPTATTVTAAPKVSAFSEKVLLEGMVTDESPGAKRNEPAVNYPRGVPAIADEYMTAWMEHLYMQKTLPENTTGVEVSLEVIDANGNYRPIGTATSDKDGFFSLDWTPDIEGKYTVIATFQGSESYWPSHAETTFVVEAAAPTPTQQPVIAAPPTDMYVLGIGTAIIVAIAIVGVVLALLIRKRP
jgi:hypothetical protein